jgi:hypothetical protein
LNKEWSKKKGNKPLVWTNDPQKGAKSFQECVADGKISVGLDA